MPDGVDSVWSHEAALLLSRSGWRRCRCRLSVTRVRGRTQALIIGVIRTRRLGNSRCCCHTSSNTSTVLSLCKRFSTGITVGLVICIAVWRGFWREPQTIKTLVFRFKCVLNLRRNSAQGQTTSPITLPDAIQKVLERPLENQKHLTVMDEVKQRGWHFKLIARSPELAVTHTRVDHATLGSRFLACKKNGHRAVSIRPGSFGKWLTMEA